MELELKRLQLFFFIEILFYLEHLYINYTNIIDMIITPIVATISAIQTTTAMNVINKQSVPDGTYVDIEMTKDVPKVQSYTSKFAEYSFYVIMAIFLIALITAMFYPIIHFTLYLTK